MINIYIKLKVIKDKTDITGSINSFIAEYCDLRKQIITTNPRDGDPYFTVVCEFRRNNLRK